MPIAYTRAIIDAIHDGSLAQAPTTQDPVFGLSVPTQCPGVPDEVLLPENTWPDPAEYRKTAEALAAQFRENFRQYEDQANAEVRQAGPSSDYTSPERASA
jgi:phosphoenolpyruvate carboxykinase (ATP)